MVKILIYFLLAAVITYFAWMAIIALTGALTGLAAGVEGL